MVDAGEYRFHRCETSLNVRSRLLNEIMTRIDARSKVKLDISDRSTSLLRR